MTRRLSDFLALLGLAFCTGYGLGAALLYQAARSTLSSP